MIVSQVSGGIGFWIGIHRVSGWRISPPPDNPMPSSSNRAVRRGKWKKVWTNFDRKWELYDIGRDRSELEDLAALHPHEVAEMDRL